MNTTMLEENQVKFNRQAFQDRISKLIDATTPQFGQIIKSYVKFNCSFLIAGVVEFLLLFILFTFWSHSSLLAFTIAAMFFTLFAYCILRLYFQTKKPDQFAEHCQQFISTAKKLINYQEGIPEHHLALANACCLFAAALQGKEYQIYKAPKWLGSLAPIIERWSGWWHWHDFHKIKENLLQESVNEHIKLVKCEPTNLEAHAALANAYVMLSGLYVDPRKISGEEEEYWSPPKKFIEILQNKFRFTAQRAIEEFKILNEYAPNDPWVHAQLAYSYRDLQMPDEEIKEYETILKLRPDDIETLFKLGTLYFQQGYNAQGLRIYEEMKKTHYTKAENLIKYYGNYNQT